MRFHHVVSRPLIIFSCLFFYIRPPTAWGSDLRPIVHPSASCAVGRLMYSFSEADRRVWQTNPGSTTGVELRVDRFERVRDGEQEWTEVDGRLPLFFGAYGNAHFEIHPVPAEGRKLDFTIRFVDPAHPFEKEKVLSRTAVPCVEAQP